MDKMELSDKDIGFQLPARVLFAAPSGHGKSSLILKILKERDRVLSAPLTAVWYCYPENSNSPKDEAFRNQLEAACPGIEFKMGIPNFTELTYQFGQKLVILDDLLQKVISNEAVFNVITVLSAHNDLSLFITTQNLYQGGRYAKTLIRNTTDRVIFNDRGDRQWVQILCKQMFPKQPQFLTEAMAWLSMHVALPYERYLVIDNNPKSKVGDHMMVRTRLFPQADGSIEPIYFTPLNSFH